MPILYKTTKYDLVCSDDHLTEQEHIPACDINKMLKAAARGQLVLGARGEPVYGYDDTNMDKLTLLIEKARLEQELGELSSQTEFTEDELKLISPELVKQFGFKVKKVSETPKNDDQTTIKGETPDLPPPNTLPKPPA